MYKNFIATTKSILLKCSAVLFIGLYSLFMTMLGKVIVKQHGTEKKQAWLESSKNRKQLQLLLLDIDIYNLYTV